MRQVINFFCRNFLKKVIALIAAFFMWFFVMIDQDPEIEDSYTIPLTISNTPYEFVAICEEKNIKIEARAPRSNFVKYDANAFRAYVNLEGLDAGEHQIIPRVIMPQGFELIETNPEIIQVKLDPLIEQQMPIELITTGNVAQNVALKDMAKSMDFVTVVGAKSSVELVSKVYGEMNLSNNNASFEVQVPMSAVDEKGNIVPRVRVVPSVITVTVEIENDLKKRTVPITPEISVADGWELKKITVEPAQIEISGEESVINSIATLKTVPFTAQTGQRFFSSNLKLSLPDGVTVENDEVKVSAEIIRNPIMRN